MLLIVHLSAKISYAYGVWLTFIYGFVLTCVAQMLAFNVDHVCMTILTFPATERPVKENGPTSPVPKPETPKSSGNLEEFYPLNMSSTTPNSLSPASRDESKGHPERKRRASDEDSLEVRIDKFVLDHILKVTNDNKCGQCVFFSISADNGCSFQ